MAYNWYFLIILDSVRRLLSPKDEGNFQSRVTTRGTRPKHVPAASKTSGNTTGGTWITRQAEQMAVVTAASSLGQFSFSAL